MNESANYCHYLSLAFDYQSTHVFQYFRYDCKKMISDWSAKFPAMAKHPPIFLNLKLNRFEWIAIEDNNYGLYARLIHEIIQGNLDHRRVFNRVNERGG